MGNILVALIKDAVHVPSGHVFKIEDLDSWNSCPENLKTQIEQDFKIVVTNGILSKLVKQVGHTESGKDIYNRM